ncbi:6-phospho-beta-glucosidase [Sporosarcina sp. ANT_H38]|uniref:6-phospho-beta-glucosidase n=1 Tax=Sporosarcina sp. ANT_H38 TaxID=2597358 RepID=UPI0011F0DC9E|nr:6-phospho-beta-glucosidase [Sporosarcina sp. ANT_H38]KAA0942119.1 6-phospho-beta-glucosidase [Sporosarcina sp. ANT_H38]
MKIAVIGGGSSYTPELIEGIILRATEIKVDEIVLVDIEAGKEKLEIVGSLAERMIKKSGLPITIVLTFDRIKAITNADFVLTQFRVGGLDARANDERIPLKYDVIGQETVGPGGFAKALRTIPVILEICKEIEQYSNDAWLINFTNPAGMVTEAIHKYTTVKAIGLCNVPINMKQMTATILEVDRDNLNMSFAGLNHLVYATKVFVNGEDKMSALIERIAEGRNMNMRNIHDAPWDKEFLQAINALPCPYHRYYYMMDEMLIEEKEAAELRGTRAEQVKVIEKGLFETYKNPNLDVKPKELEERGGSLYSEAAISLIASIVTNDHAIHTVNVPNNGTITDLPDDVVIEVSCVVNSEGPQPIQVGKLPPELNGLIQQIKAFEQLTIEAAVTGNKHKALLALTTNPFVPSSKVAKLLLDELLEVNQAYLPQFLMKEPV